MQSCVLSVIFAVSASWSLGAGNEYAVPRSSSFAVHRVGGQVSESRSGRDGPMNQIERESNAGSLVRHLRGAPGGPFSSVDPEIDRRLHQMTRTQGLPHD
jgi:hypothetical protein